MNTYSNFIESISTHYQAIRLRIFAAEPPMRNGSDDHYQRDLDRYNEIAKTVRRVFYTLVATDVFCVVALAGTTDANWLKGEDRARSFSLPLLDFPMYHEIFLIAAPVLLIGISFYLHTFVEELNKEQFPAKDRHPMLTSFEGIVANLAVGVGFYLMVPLTLLVFVFRAAPSSAAMFLAIFTLFYTMLMVLLLIRRCPKQWRNKRILLVPLMFLFFATPLALIQIFMAGDRFVRWVFQVEYGVCEGIKPSSWYCSFDARNMRDWNFSRENFTKLTFKYRDNFSGANFAGATLTEATIRNGTFNHVDFTDAILTDTTFIETTFKGAKFEDAELAGADFTESTFDEESNFSGADLRDATFNNVIGLKEVEFDAHQLKGISLQKVDLSEKELRGFDLTGTDLRGADLSDADLRDAKITNAILTDTIFNKTTLDADLRGIDLSGANLLKANLKGAELDKDQLKGINLRETDLSYLNLSRFVLIGTELQGAKLRGTNLEGVDLSKTKLSNAELKETKLTKGQLKGIKLIDAELSDLNLSDFDLIGTNLTSADLDNVDLRCANLANASLANADLKDVKLKCNKLIGVSFSTLKPKKTDLTRTDLSGASLGGVNLSGVDLSRARGLTQSQIAEACGDNHTKLPQGLESFVC